MGIFNSTPICVTEDSLTEFIGKPMFGEDIINIMFKDCSFKPNLKPKGYYKYVPINRKSKKQILIDTFTKYCIVEVSESEALQYVMKNKFN